MQKADYLLRLMKQRTDELVATDEKLQQFLMWVNEKSLSVKVSYEPAAVRAFYFAVVIARDIAVTQDLDLSGSRDLARALNLHINHTDNFDIIVDLNLGRILARAHALTHTLDDAFPRNLLDLDFYRPFAYILNLKLDLEFEQELQQLKTQLPNPFDEIFKQSWQANGQAWIEQLRAVMIEHRNIGHDWQFSDEQKELLKQYYRANKLLINCLNNASNVTPAVRSQIEETLLLPIAAIEKHR
jgi:hypothetical protein